LTTLLAHKRSASPHERSVNNAGLHSVASQDRAQYLRPLAGKVGVEASGGAESMERCRHSDSATVDIGLHLSARDINSKSKMPAGACSLTSCKPRVRRGAVSA
jgi:hypothetical protein